MVTPGVVVLTVPETVCASRPPLLVICTLIEPVPPGRMVLVVTVPRFRCTCGCTPAAVSVLKASTMPQPLSRSYPAAMMSVAEPAMMVVMYELGLSGCADLSSAATAAAWGAAAEVPKNGFNPLPDGKVVLTPSGAAIDGWRRGSGPPGM